MSFLKSIQDLSDEWRQLSQDQKDFYKEKATELHQKRKEERRRSREEAQESIRKEQLQKKAYQSIISFRI